MEAKPLSNPLKELNATNDMEQMTFWTHLLSFLSNPPTKPNNPLNNKPKKCPHQSFQTFDFYYQPFNLNPT